jgi:hypothetical protein
MNRILTITVLAGLLTVAAGCGGDDGGPSLSRDQETVADRVVTESRAAGFELDGTCVRGVASQLSAEDAALLAADLESEEVSVDGETLAADLMGCVDRDAFVDAMVTELESTGLPLDGDCVRTALADLDLEEFMNDAMADDPSAFLALIMPCVRD